MTTICSDFKFKENYYGECWGKIYEEWQENIKVYKFLFNAQILYRELAKGGFEFNTVKKDWVDMKFLKHFNTITSKYITLTFIIIKN